MSARLFSTISPHSEKLKRSPHAQEPPHFGRRSASLYRNYHVLKPAARWRRSASNLRTKRTELQAVVITIPKVGIDLLC